MLMVTATMTTMMIINDDHDDHNEHDDDDDAWGDDNARVGFPKDPPHICKITRITDHKWAS